MFTAVYFVFSPHFDPVINHLGGFVIAKKKKKIDISCLCVCLPNADKFRHNIVKVCEEITRQFSNWNSKGNRIETANRLLRSVWHLSSVREDAGLNPGWGCLALGQAGK